MSIVTNLNNVRNQLPNNVKLVAVSKFHPSEAVLEAYNAGQQLFGESRVQELDKKVKELPSDIQWHQIGHLQTNKVKNIVPYIDTIQSVDSIKLLLEINKQAEYVERVINCFLEIKVAQEESKYGFNIDECFAFLDQGSHLELKNVRICGVMGMATYTDDNNQVRSEFKLLKRYFDMLKDSFFKDQSYFCELSMGMSHDYQIAVEEGATIVRVGTSIFGIREY